MDRELAALIPEGFEEKGTTPCIIHKSEHKAIRLENEKGEVLLLCYEVGITYEMDERNDSE